MSKDTTKKGLGRVNTARKVWYRIIAPKLFGQMELGETYLSSPEQALGRPLKINLKDLTGNVKDQNAYVNFKIDAQEGNVLKASVTGYELTATYVKKLVRKNTNRLDDFFVFRSRDGKELVLKSLIVTQIKAQRSVQKQLRQTLKALLDEELKKSTFENFMENLVTRKVQMSAKKALHKIYPLNEVAVRVLILKKSGLPVVEEVAVEEMPAAENAETSETMEEEPAEETSPAEAV